MTRAFVIRLALSVLVFVVAVLPGRNGIFDGVLQSAARNVLHGATYVPPQDLGELAVLSGAVVVARAASSESASRGLLIFTRTEFVVEESLSGPLDRGVLFTVETPGGEVDGRAWTVTGSPRFTGGASYFLCLHRKGESTWRPAMLSYGVLEDVPADDGTRMLIPLPEAGSASLLSRRDGVIPEFISTYRKASFLASLSEVLEGRASWDASRVVAEVESLARQRKAPPPQCAFFSDRGRRIRWNTFDTGGSATIFGLAPGDESLPGGGFEEVVGALEMWMGIPGTGLNLIYGGEVEVAPSCRAGDSGEPGVILFNDPCSDIADLNRCSGVLAFGGPLTNGTHRFDGETWETVVGWVVVVNDGVGCLGSSGYRSMMAHELGHGLGFAHVDDDDALMFASCCNNINVTDRICAEFAYPARDADNERPVVNVGADRRIVITGNTAFLLGSMSDDGRPVGNDIDVNWTQLSGPGTAVFGDASALETSVTFPRAGTYAMRLTADDGELVGTDYVRIQVETNVGSQVAVEFQQELNGYQGTVDANLLEEDPSADSSRQIELEVDARSATSLDEVHVLLRFDDIFGVSPGQVPPRATIRSALLTLSSTNFGDGANFHRMARPWSDQASWSDFESRGVVVGIDAFDVADAATSGREGTVQVDVTVSVSAWSEDPCSNYGWALLPRGTDGWHFHSAEGAIPPRLSVEHSPSAEIPLEGGDAWTFRRGKLPIPEDWNQESFDDSDWEVGRTSIGYGDGDDRTVLADMRGNYISVFARKIFAISSAEPASEFSLTVIYDDGVVVYLNGEELGRANMPEGEIHPTTAALRDGDVETVVFRIGRGQLRDGPNLLAVSVHNAQLSSSDLTFDAVLVPLRVDVRPVDCDAPEIEFRRADVTDDGTIDITDAVVLLFFLFQNGSPPPCPDAADIDDDGSLNISDAVNLLGVLFSGGSLAAPGGICGVDPTPDELEDCASVACEG